MFKQVILQGWQVKLIPLELTHIDDLYDAGQSPDIWRYLPSNIQSHQDMRLWVEKAIAAKDSGLQLPFIILNQEQKVIGSSRLIGFPGYGLSHRQFEIGWTWLAPLAWRKKINTISKYLLLKHCFEGLHAIRVQLKTDSRNIASQKAIENIGAIREGVFRNHQIMPDGWVRDSIYYSILAEEWSLIQSRLENSIQAAYSDAG
jgi:RimJ/RimL family protein N-acetyltransferase